MDPPPASRRPPRGIGSPGGRERSHTLSDPTAPVGAVGRHGPLLSGSSVPCVMAEDPTTLPAPFDAETVSTVAAASGCSPTRLATLVVDHQALVGRYTSVSGWVYELRGAFPTDPLVARTATAHYLLVAPSVWAEFAAALDVDPDGGAARALREVHDRTARATLQEEFPPSEDRLAMVVVRQ